MTTMLLQPEKEWYEDHAASGVRYRRWPELSRDELLAYEDGRWEVRLGSANGFTVASGKELSCEQAKQRAVMVYVALLLPCTQGERPRCGKPTVFKREDGRPHLGPALPCPLDQDHDGECK